jgi:hypothetical protein
MEVVRIKVSLLCVYRFYSLNKQKNLLKFIEYPVVYLRGNQGHRLVTSIFILHEIVGITLYLWKGWTYIA